MQSTQQAQLVTKLKTNVSASISDHQHPDHNQHAENADLDHAADGAGDYHPAHNERSGKIFRRASSDVHRRSFRRVFRAPSTVTTDRCLFTFSLGSVVMQVRGQKELTLGPGQSFYEDPNAIHTLAGTQVVQNQQNSLCSLFTNKGLRWCYQESHQQRPLEDRKEESAC